MIGHLAGLLGANVLFLGAGLGITRLLGCWASPGAASRVLGLSYMSGVACITLLGTLALVVGVNPTVPVVAGACVVLAASGLARRRPGSLPEAERGPGRRLTVALQAGLAVYLAAVLLRSVFKPLAEWDGTVVWALKARALVLLGGLDPAFFANPAYEFSHQGYPLFLPTLEAIGFHSMGSLDTNVLHVQFALLFVGFLVAAGELLRAVVPPVLLWSSLLLLALAPSLYDQLLNGSADVPLALFFGLAAVAGWRYVSSADPRFLAFASMFAAAAVMTKREGWAFALALALPLGAFALRRRLGFAWLACAAVPLLVLVPWLLWTRDHHLASEREGVLYTQTFHPASLADRAGRLPPAAEELARQAFDPRAWLVILPLLVLVGAAGAFLVPALRAAALYAAAVVGLIFAALLWAYWVGDTPTVQGLLAGSADRVVTTGLVFAGLFLPILAAGLSAHAPGAALQRSRTR